MKSLSPQQRELFHWIKERESIRAKKEAGLPKPWTQDRILMSYKFCNVNREDDRVTRWIFRSWLEPYSDSPNIAFAVCVARHFNWPDTLDDIGFPHQWDAEKTRSILKARKSQGKKVYTGAYTVSTGGLSMEKIDYSVDHVFTPLFERIRNPRSGETLQSYWEYLQTQTGFASFMAGQVVADLKFIEPLRSATDWLTWAPLGPGSMRGLNRYHDRKLKSIISQDQGHVELLDIQQQIREELAMSLPLHNVQNCMCEYDKYIRLKYENGHVRSKYNGAH